MLVFDRRSKSNPDFRDSIRTLKGTPLDGQIHPAPNLAMSSEQPSTTRRAAGRPTVDDKDRRTRRIQFRITPEEATDLLKRARVLSSRDNLSNARLLNSYARYRTFARRNANATEIGSRIRDAAEIHQRLVHIEDALAEADTSTDLAKRIHTELRTIRRLTEITVDEADPAS